MRVRFGFTIAQITEPLPRWALAKRASRPAYLMYQDYGPGIEGGALFRKEL